MKKTGPSQIEKALTFIAAQGGARTPAIAELLGISLNAVMPVLTIALDRGYLIACKVEVPGKRPANEYRLSASASESNQSWADFKEAHKLGTKPLKIGKERPPREPLASKPPSTAKVSPHFETPAALAAPLIRPSVATAVVARTAEPAVLPPARDPQRIVFMVDSNGQLRIEMGDKTIICSTEETRDAGELLVASETIWSE